MGKLISVLYCVLLILGREVSNVWVTIVGMRLDNYLARAKRAVLAASGASLAVCPRSEASATS